MRKILLLSIFSIVIIAGCAQQPTGEFLRNQLLEPECIQDWNCTGWSGCVRTGGDTGTQSRTCMDNKNCDNITSKPPESRICGLPQIALKEPSQMALEISDLSKDKNWTTVEKNIKAREEVSQIEKDLGFKKGYYVHHFSQYKENENIVSIGIYHFVSIYPVVNSAINMSYSFDAAKENYKVGNLYESTNKRILSISEFSDPSIGDFSIAYNITVSDITGFKENIYTIAFTKWDVAEVITTDGSKSDFVFLKELAKIAELKIV